MELQLVTPLIPALLLGKLHQFVEFSAAAEVQVALLDAPVLDLLTKQDYAEPLHQVDFAREVKVENVAEKAWVAVKVVLHLGGAEVVAELQDGFFGATTQEATQAGLRELFQNAVLHSLLETPDVDINKAIIRAVRM